MTMTTRRVLNSKLTNTTTATRRVYLTRSRPPPGAPQHVRGYRSSLQNPYFANSVIVAEFPEAAGSESFWQQAFRWYSDKLSTHPLTTKGLTGAVIAAAGDGLCQAGTYEESHEKPSFFGGGGWDARRSFHFFVLGLAFVAPTSHYWYGNLAVHPWTRGQSFGQISKRVALDQLVWSPVFFVIWLTGFWGMERKGDTSEIKNDLRVALPDVLVANWILWIPCQYLNFYAVPIKFQVLFTNVVELAWNAYLSFATEGGGHGHGNNQIEEEKKEEQR